ncbi:MAG: RHS repeat domain-containing protein, partial [Saprospiraceae bacterium]
MTKAIRHRSLLWMLLLPLFLSSTIFAQGDLGAAFNPEANVPASPEVAALGKYGDIPINNYSGIPNIEVPLYTIKSKDLTVPISMSYFSNGIGVSEEASWTGLAWTLDVGGMISHSIRGKDDFSYSQHCDSYVPYYTNRDQVPSYPRHPFVETGWKKIGANFTSFVSEECPTSCDLEVDYAVNYDENGDVIPLVFPSHAAMMANMTNEFWFQTDNDGWANETGDFTSYDSDYFCPNMGPKQDLEPDLFSFNFLGFSGKFVIDRAGNCVPLDVQDIKIEITGVAPSYAFTITTNDGTKYYFGHTSTARQITGTKSKTFIYNNNDLQNPVSVNNSCGEGFWNEHVSSWYLEKIVSVNGDLIQFNYAKPANTYVMPIPSMHETANDLTVSSLNFEDGLCFGTVPNTTAAVRSRTITEMRYDQLYLASIEHDYGKVIFKASGNRADLLGGKRLDALEVYRGNQAPFTPFKKYKFNYDYFNAAPTPAENKWNTGYNGYADQDLGFNRLHQRLKLKSIEDRGSSFGVPPELPPYEFFYQEDFKLPAKTSMSVDHWGYANGPTGNSFNTTFLPQWEGLLKFFDNGNTYVLKKIPGADKTPNADYTAAFLLEQINYPTGGFTKLSYEANCYSNLENPYSPKAAEATIKYLPNAGNIPPPTDLTVSTVQQYPVAFAEVSINWNILSTEEGICSPGGSINFVDGNLTNGIGFQAILRNLANPNPNTNIIKTWDYDGVYFNRTNQAFSLAENLNLTPGGNYQMEIVPSCNYANGLPQNIDINYSINWLDYTLVTSKTGGGMRIKSIEDHDGNNPTNKKWFAYRDSSGVCSGIAINHPEYMKVKAFNGGCSALNSLEWKHRDLLDRSSSSVRPLSKAAAGSFIGYSQVTTHYGGNNEGGKSDFHYYNEAPVNESGESPQGMALFYNQKNGSLLKQIDYKKITDDNFLIVRETENTYNNFFYGDENFPFIWGMMVTTNPWLNTAIVTDCINYRAQLYLYASVPQWHYVVATTERNFDENGEDPIVSQTNYEYEDTHFNLIATATTNSDGTTQRTETAYAYSENPAIFSANLLNKHMTGIPVQVKQFQAGELVVGSRLKFNAIAANDNLTLPTDFYKYEYDPDNSEENNWVWSGKMIYNTDGYPQELERPNYGSNYSYQWENGLLMSRKYKDWTSEYNYTNDRLLQSTISIDGLSTNYNYDRYHRLKLSSTRGGKVQVKNSYFTGFGNNYIETQTIYSDTDDQVSKQLFDGLGRLKAVVAVGHGVNNEDVTTERFYYDNQGRQNLTNHYVTGNTIQEFEASPLGRTLQEKSYLESGAVKIEYHYYANQVTDEVINYQLGGFYPAQSLYKTEMIDENGNRSIDFMDQLGRTILSRKFVNGEAVANRVDTYTVYDGRGNVKEIITPGENGVAGPSYLYKYNARNLLIEKTIPNAGVQSYTYDARDRLVTSTDANGNVISTIYDDYDRPIRTILEGVGILSETFYDTYQGVSKSCNLGSGGAILKGKITGSRVRTLTQDGLGDWLYTTNCYDLYGRIINTITDNHIGGFDENQILEINAADQVKRSKRIHKSANGNYEINQTFDFDHSFRTKQITHQVAGGGLNSSDIVTLSHINYNNKDQVIEKNLGGTLQSIDYRYNQKGWLTHINSVNTISGDLLAMCGPPQVLGACTTCLPPTGTIPSPTEPKAPEKLLNPTVLLHFNLAALAAGEATNLVLKQNYILVSETDSTSVVVTQSFKIGNPVGPTAYTDSLTQHLSNTNISAADIDVQVSNLVNLLSQDLSLVLSNTESLTKVTDKLTEYIGKKWNNELPSSSVADNDLFGMELKYDRGEELLGSTPQYNGNIAQVFWQVQGSATQSYAFQYDELDRLKKAKYAGVTKDQYLAGDQYSVDNLNYDHRGNIKTLRRYGMVQQSTGCYNAGQIDNLKYSYGGNQLGSVTDKTVNAYAAEGYDGSGSFEYDANGNMVYDGNKKVAVKYNHLNLPKKFIFEMEEDIVKYIEILYDAAGIKLQKKVYDGTNTMVRDYAAGIEYQDQQLEAIYHEEGRVIPTVDGFRYEYTLKDHLGNARLSFSDFNGNGIIDETVYDPNNPEINETEVLQENHYYPFGMNMNGPWAPQLPTRNLYQYNGKELNEDFGLDWNDYGARWYDAAIGRWH